MNRNRFAIALCVVLTLIAVSRILLTYPVTSQGYDETYHLACGMEWIDKGQYTLDPVHPPLARIAIVLPTYLAGERFPKFAANDSTSASDYLLVGNSILYGDGHYLRNLSLARLGILPFLFLAVAVAFLWTRRLFGNLAAVMAVLLLTSLPIVLAFSGLAYTDFPAAAMMLAALFVTARWLEAPTIPSSLWLGVSLGLAFLTKFTAVLFVPVGALGMILAKWLMSRRDQAVSTPKTKWVTRLALAAMVAGLLVWGGYRFSFQHVQEGMQLSPASMPSFQRFPGPVRTLARRVVLWDPPIPAPAMIKGMAATWAFTKNGATSYLFGEVRNGSWWYFFLVGIAVKTPLPTLLLCVIGLGFSVGLVRQGPWNKLAPSAALIALLLATTLVKYDAGQRHVLVIYPLMAVVGGYGAARLWQLDRNWRLPGRLLLAALLVLQLISSVRAHPDYLAYFNFLAGRDPSRILVTGCDLDCGQDLFKLSQALRERHISHVSVGVWTTADLSRMDLPSFDLLQPFQPVTGWVAIGVRSLRMGTVGRSPSAPGAFAWLEPYQPVAEIGKTIRLYYIPEPAGPGNSGETGKMGEVRRTTGGTN